MIETERLLLIPATTQSLQAELAGDREALARYAGTLVPQTWPPDELYDDNAVRYSLELIAREPLVANWGTLYFARKGEPAPRLIGIGGYKGPPRDGFVEVGYAVAPEERRNGYALEATLAMTGRAFEQSDVRRVIAHTLSHLTPSIGVLEKAGFRLSDETLEEGAVMYLIERERWEQRQ